MHVNLKHKLGKKLNIIYPGEYYISDEDEFIGTLLGSCVSVCLHDRSNNINLVNLY